MQYPLNQLQASEATMEGALPVPDQDDRQLGDILSSGRRLSYLVTGAAASAVFVVFALFATVPTYRVAPIFLLPLLWGVYLLRRRLCLHPLHFAMYATALVLHDFGAFGMYQRGVLGISYDVYVHFYFAFVVVFMLHRAIQHNFPVGPWVARVATLMFMMGFGALHEIMEYASYLLLGEEKGMLRPHTSYFFDTQRDLLNNLLGSLMALVLIGGWRFLTPRPVRCPGESEAAEQEVC